ncbi:MAG: hypothetical protein ACRD0P_12460 [Stackebrandtia sp.]
MCSSSRTHRQYALANKVQHPRNVFVREHQVTALLDVWLAKVLAPHRIKQMIEDLYGAQEPQVNAAAMRAKAQIADCASKLGRHRAALEAGATPQTIAVWMTQTEAQLAAAQTELRTAQAERRRTLSVEEIEALMAALGDLVHVLADATAEMRQAVYQTLGVRLGYHPGKHEVRVEANLDPDSIVSFHDPRFGRTVRVRGANTPDRTWQAWCPIGDPFRITVSS